MGRRSKLTDAQWADIERRMLEGDAVRALAREFQVSEAAIRARKSTQVEQIKTVANQIVATERAIQALPIPAQITAHSLAAKLRAISDNLASAAHYGAATAHRLNALANSEVAKIDDADPLKSGDSLKGVMVLSRLANDSASIALNLLAANKESVQKMNEDAPPPPTVDAAKLSDAALAELMSARAAAQ